MEYTGERNIKGERNGQGTYTYADGATYTGAFKDDLRNGQGTYTYASGRTFTSEWKDGEPEP